MLAGGDENGRARLLRVVEHAHGIAQSGRDVEIDHRELARGLRIAIRHPHDGGFLQSKQIPQLILGRERVHQRQFGRAGIAEHDLDALLLEQIEEGALSGHQGQDGLRAWGKKGASLRSARVSYHAGNALRSARYGLKSELV